MKLDKEKTVVVFRKFIERDDDGEVIAIFPGQAAARRGKCGAYMHVGQHGDCDPREMVSITRPATEDEYAPLAKELRRAFGYNLKVRKRLAYRYMWWALCNQGAT